MPTYFPNNQDENVPRRRAGLRSDELLPGESLPPDEEHEDIHAVGTPGGGLASGGMAGTNAGDGSIEDVEMEDAMSTGIYDNSGDNGEENEPEAGPTGGAAGGTPAGKRSGPRLHQPHTET